MRKSPKTFAWTSIMVASWTTRAGIERNAPARRIVDARADQNAILSLYITMPTSRRKSFVDKANSL